MQMHYLSSAFALFSDTKKPRVIRMITLGRETVEYVCRNRESGAKMRQVTS